MNHSARLEMYSGECAVNRESQQWNMNLCQMYVDFLSAVSTSEIPSVDSWQIQLCGQDTVDTALASTCVN